MITYFFKEEAVNLKEVRVCQSEAALSERARRPKRDLGHKIALCQSFSMARRYGWTVASWKEDQVCPFGAVATPQIA